MSFPAQNLHEFVLTLLTDEAARSAFAADPTAALADAGLSDVTPQEVLEVVPLVAEYAPELPSVPDLDSSFSATALGSPDGVIGTLAYTGDGGISAVSGEVSAEGVEVAGAAVTETASVGGELGTNGDTLSGGAGLQSPLGEYSVSTESDPASATQLAGSVTSSLLDKAEPAAGTVASYVSGGGELVAETTSTTGNTLGNYLTTGGAAVGETVAEAGTDLSEQVAASSETIAETVADVSEEAPALPEAAALPEVPASVPELPTPQELTGQLPPDVKADLPDLPKLSDLPDLPNLPVVNPLPVVEQLTETVADIVSNSPLGEVTGAIEDGLSKLGDLTEDLHFDH